MFDLSSFLCNKCQVNREESLDLEADPITTVREKRMVFCTDSIIRVKESARGRIAWANQQLKNGSLEQELAECTPILEKFTSMLSDLDEAAFLEAQRTLHEKMRSKL